MSAADRPHGAAVSDGQLSLTSAKIRDWHRQRKALVYIRQSTPQQVLDHRESADRQYALAQRAGALQVEEVDVGAVDEAQRHDRELRPEGP